MKKILVSGASGIVGYGILGSLRKSSRKLCLVGTTIYTDSVAPGFSDEFELAKPTAEEGYIEWLLGVVKKREINLLIPGIEADVFKWAENLAAIKKEGVQVVLNDTNLISLCKDKWVFFESLSKKNFPYTIPTSLDSDFDSIEAQYGLPFLLKPRRGFGARGIVRINDREGFAPHAHEIGAKLMVQPIVGNDNEEYTTAAFCDGTGSFHATVTLRRKLSKDGFTEQAEVAEIKEIPGVVQKLCEIFKPEGPTNFQFRIHAGRLCLLEINPRISSSTSIRTAFGYNESEMAVDYYLEGRKPVQPSVKKGKAIRYTEDMIYYADRDNL